MSALCMEGLPNGMLQVEQQPQNDLARLQSTLLQARYMVDSWALVLKTT